MSPLTPRQLLEAALTPLTAALEAAQNALASGTPLEDDEALIVAGSHALLNLHDAGRTIDLAVRGAWKIRRRRRPNAGRKLTAMRKNMRNKFTEVEGGTNEST